MKARKIVAGISRPREIRSIYVLLQNDEKQYTKNVNHKFPFERQKKCVSSIYFALQALTTFVRSFTGENKASQAEVSNVQEVLCLRKDRFEAEVNLHN